MPRYLPVALLLMVLIAAALPVRAQSADPEREERRERRDFEWAAEAAAPMAGESYPWVRCAGLYRAMRLHAGRRELGRDRYDYARQVDALLTRKAALERADEFEQPWPSAEMQAEADVAAIARLYLRRFEGMIAETGRPWTRDFLWQEDNAGCGGLLDEP